MVDLTDQSKLDPGQIRRLVQQVLFAVARACRAPESDQYVLAVFTGATAGLTRALSGLEHLMLNGMMLRVLMSESADHLYGDVVNKRLMAWPNARTMDKKNWIGQVQKSMGVVVPMLSVASLSRVCTLTPDTPAANIIFHALSMGKPVTAAIDGAAPGSADRRILGLDQGSPALAQALADRLIRFADFGAKLTWSRDLGRVALGAIEPCAPPLQASLARPKTFVTATKPVSTDPPVRLVDAGLIKQARTNGRPVQAVAGAVITPLAMELARGWGIEINFANPLTALTLIGKDKPW